MERLTISANGRLCADLIARDGDPCEYICQERADDDGCDGCPIMAAFERLSAYEDTGMTPEEIIQMKIAHGGDNHESS